MAPQCGSRGGWVDAALLSRARGSPGSSGPQFPHLQSAGGGWGVGCCGPHGQGIRGPGSASPGFQGAGAAPQDWGAGDRLCRRGCGRRAGSTSRGSWIAAAAPRRPPLPLPPGGPSPARRRREVRGHPAPSPAPGMRTDQLCQERRTKALLRGRLGPPSRQTSSVPAGRPAPKPRPRARGKVAGARWGKLRHRGPHDPLHRVYAPRSPFPTRLGTTSRLRAGAGCARTRRTRPRRSRVPAQRPRRPGDPPPTPAAPPCARGGGKGTGFRQNPLFSASSRHLPSDRVSRFTSGSLRPPNQRRAGGPGRGATPPCAPRSCVTSGPFAPSLNSSSAQE